MANASAIEWTDLTWNPVHGCSIVSTECRECYAMTLSLRRGQTAKPWTPANAAENVILKPHKLREPFSGAKAWRGQGDAAKAAGLPGKLVFVNSMSDLFHEQVPNEFIARVFGVMGEIYADWQEFGDAGPGLRTFQILTKRPQRMAELLKHPEFERKARLASGKVGLPWPLPNVWLGVSIGLRHFVRRADLLRDTPAAVRFISAEPLLGPLMFEFEGPWLDLTCIDWLIIGGESGPKARPMDLDWARDLRDACGVTGTAPFVKQLGKRLGAELGAGPKGGDIDRWPQDLRVREFPATVPAI